MAVKVPKMHGLKNPSPACKFFLPLLHTTVFFLQKEEERLRASIRRESQQRRMREKQHQRGLSASYLEPDRYDEEDEGEEAISLAAIKNRYKGGIRGMYILWSHGLCLLWNSL